MSSEFKPQLKAGRFPPLKGDVWSWANDNYTFLGETKDFGGVGQGISYLAVDPHDNHPCNWYEKHFFDGTLTFVKFSDPIAQIDWNDWLPPHELPNTGVKQLKAGQIWAWRRGAAAGSGAVVHISDGAYIDHDVLASIPGTWNAASMSSGDRGRYAVLVQDVDQDAPTDPDILYQRFYK